MDALAKDMSRIVSRMERKALRLIKEAEDARKEVEAAALKKAEEEKKANEAKAAADA